MPLNRIECPSCGAGLKSAAGFTAGQKVRCPKCQAAFAVEEPDADDAPPPPPKPVAKPAARPPAPAAKVPPAKAPVRAAVAAAADDEEEEDDDRPRKKRPARSSRDDDRPRKKKKKRTDDDGGYKNSPLRYAVLGLLLLGLAGACYYRFVYLPGQEAKVVEAPPPKDDDADLAKPIKTDPGRKAAPKAGGSVSSVQRKLRSDDLKRIGMAMHAYAGANNDGLPGDILSADKKPLLSWRVAILPYLEQNALYSKFNLNEPWNGPTNSPLIAQMPKVFGDSKGATAVKVFFGKGAWFDAARTMNLNRVPDGTTNTIMAVEAGVGVTWTKPDDIPFDADKPLPNLTPPDGTSTFLAVMGDASVRPIDRNKVSEKTLKAAITADGGETLGPDW